MFLYTITPATTENTGTYRADTNFYDLEILLKEVPRRPKDEAIPSHTVVMYIE
jgi:hypothetical protein